MTPSNLIPEEPPAKGWAAVYWLYDTDGQLLYIGSSRDLDARWRVHRRKASWWPQVASFKLEWHANRSRAYDAETKAIAAEQPKCNLMGTRRYSQQPLTPKQLERTALASIRERVRTDAERAGLDAYRHARAAGVPMAEAERLQAQTVIDLMDESGLMPGAVARRRKQLVDRTRVTTGT